MKTCEIDGCQRPFHARGWCKTHYLRERKHGDVHVVVKARIARGTVPCSVADCERWNLENGLCGKHAQRLRKTGTTDVTSEWRGRSLEERFWKHVDKGAPDECWIWTGDRNPQGYGQFGIYRNNKRKRFLAHRYVLELAGVLDDSLVVLHSCDNPPCMNPAHLSQGTQGDNIRDAIAKGRMDMSGLLVRQQKGPRESLGGKTVQERKAMRREAAA